MQVLVAFCTFPDEETARRVATELVDLKLVACANVMPRVHSIYRWQGKVESADESLVMFKLASSRYANFETKLREAHPYDVPAIVACAIDKGLPGYLDWVTDSCIRDS
jgi:periplasmic divalent cation tolerance protein